MGSLELSGEAAKPESWGCKASGGSGGPVFTGTSCRWPGSCPNPQAREGGQLAGDVTCHTEAQPAVDFLLSNLDFLSTLRGTSYGVNAPHNNQVMCSRTVPLKAMELSSPVSAP